MSALTPDVIALLAAVRDALDIPVSHWDDASERAHHQTLNERASVARITLDGILDKGHDIPTAVDWLNERVAMMPVTYTVWVPKHSEGGEPQ